LEANLQVATKLGPVLHPPGRVIALIPVHNETDTIATTIAAVQGQSKAPDELCVLIDNHDPALGSTAIAPATAE
jgi:hypothetical protein